MALLATARRASSLPILRRASSVLLGPVASPFPATRRSSSSSIRAAKTALMNAAMDTVNAEHGSSAWAAALDSLRAATDSLSNASFEDQLLRGIDSAVKSSEPPRIAEMEDTAGCFPFEVSENRYFVGRDYKRYITLRRSFEDEKIEVATQIDCLEKDGKSSLESLCMQLGHGKGEKKASRPSLTFDVIVSKSNGYELQFTCVAYPDDVIIRSMNMTPGGSPKEQELLEDMYKYDGFNKLDENLKKSFHNYLELRGITPMTMNLFREYIISNGTRKQHFWLNKLSDFVKKD
ncbi:uncharacterized protein At2g39795, mitochondrial-like [Aegilops tauschii subsp. strangulata]|nr:uncharacterized protein At2g39795, mitochondrial-like [Aegilops tauschii subsp. strangulata]